MALNIFKKNNPDKEVTKKDATIESESKVINDKDDNVSTFKASGGDNSYKVLKGFYVSEKSAMGGVFNQYTFKVFNVANKSEIKKEIGKLFDVKVKKVQIINRPRKKRDIGRHPGFKPGFKKAVVVLEKGYEIKQVNV